MSFLMASFPRLDDVISDSIVTAAPRQMVADAVSLVVRGPSGICLIDPAMKIVTCNQRLLDIFGYAEIAEVSGMDFSLLMAPSERPTARKIHQRLDEGLITEIDGEWRGLTRRGEAITVSDVSTTSTMSNGSRIRLASIQDITRRRHDDPANAPIGASAFDMRLMEIIASDMTSALSTAQKALTGLGAALDNIEHAAWKPGVDEIENQIRKIQGVLEHAQLSLGNRTYHRIAVNMQDMADEWSLDPAWLGYNVANNISMPCLAIIDPGATKSCINSILRSAQNYVTSSNGKRSDISISFDAFFEEKSPYGATSVAAPATSSSHADASTGPHISITISNQKPVCNLEKVGHRLSLNQPATSNDAIANLSMQAASRLAADHGGEIRLVEAADGGRGLSIILPLAIT